MKRSDRFNHDQGNNTGLKLPELKNILEEMLSGNFDYDGRNPEIAIEEIKEDIRQLEDTNV